MLFGPQSESNRPGVTKTKSKRKKNKSNNSLTDKKSKNESNGVRNTKKSGTVKSSTKLNNKKNEPRSQDPSSMYRSVWKSLGFRSKVLKLSPQAMNKYICVTGVDGFASSWIVALLLEKGYKVRGTVQNRSDDISGLSSLPNAETNLQIVEASLLTPESCDLAVEDCEYVIHTGTPSSCAVRDPLSETLEPGVHSVGSRMHCIIPMMTNFIQACARAKVKKVVLTSSISAMADTVTPNSIVTDISWNSESTLEKNPHFLSLKLAEEAAWQLVDQLPRESKFSLVSINLGTLMGPMLCKGKIPSGNQVVYDLITGQYSALVDLNWALVDVRDSAKAHILALENFEARGRHICVNRTVWLKDIVDTLSTNGYSGRDLPWKVGLPNWVARMPSYASQLGQVGASLYAYDPANSKLSPYLNDKITQSLSMSFCNSKNTIIDTADDLLKWGLIKPWAEDHEAIECACCRAAFTFYRRKHHCRECGVIICADCSMSRAVVEGLEDKARLCDSCVKSSVPALLELLQTESDDNQRKAVIALESLMENECNHDYVTRNGGVPLLLSALHVSDETVAQHAAGAIYALSSNISSSLQMVLEGAVLQMLEVDESSSTWRVALLALRNIWRQINKQDFRRMLHAVARVSSDAAIGALKGNILLTFVHMMNPTEITSLLPEGLMSVFHSMLMSADVYPRCAAAHAIKHLIPASYSPDATIIVPPYIVDDHEELLTNAALSDIQFLVKGHIAPINAHKVVLFFRNAYFKNMFGSATSHKSTIEVENCSYEVFSMLLRFLYTGKVHIESSSAQELLKAASFYQVYELQKRTEKYLSSEISVENVVDLLYLADCCYAEDLKRVCIGFLMKNIHAAIRLPSYERHRVWASQEVLSALASILGPEWEFSYLEVIRRSREKKAHGCSSLPGSPLSKALKAHSPRRIESIASKQKDVTQVINDMKSVSSQESPNKKQQGWPDDISEGIC